MQMADVGSTKRAVFTFIAVHNNSNFAKFQIRFDKRTGSVSAAPQMAVVYP